MMGAGMAAHGHELVPGQALEPLTLPVPELPPVAPSLLLTRLDAVSMLRVDISKDGLISITPVVGTGTESLRSCTGHGAVCAVRQQLRHLTLILARGQSG